MNGDCDFSGFLTCVNLGQLAHVAQTMIPTKCIRVYMSLYNLL